MKKFYLALSLLLFSLAPLRAQSPNWIWGRSGGGTGIRTQAHDVAVDPAGNIYITGYFFSGPSITFGNQVINSNGQDDIYVVKYDASGNVLWTRSAGGAGSDDAISIESDPSGNIYVAGYYYSDTITFGPFTLANTDTSGMSEDVFIAKYDPSGNVLWAHSYGGLGNDESYALCTDVNGNVFQGGNFSGPTITFGVSTLFKTGSYDYDGFVVKYDSTGTILWARSVGGDHGDEVTALSADSTGNVFVTGNFGWPSMNFGNITLVNSGTQHAVFIGKYDASGNVLWAHSAGDGVNWDYAMAICADPYGNAYLTGGFGSPSFVIGNDTLFNSDNVCTDIYLAKYNATGNLLWAQGVPAFNGGHCDYGESIAIDPGGRIYLSGDFTSDTIIFGNSVITQNTLFIAVFDTAGIADCAAALRTNGYWNPSVIDRNGNLYITGDFEYTNVYSGNDVLYLNGTRNVLLAKYKFNCAFTEVSETDPLPAIQLYPNVSADEITLQTYTVSRLPYQVFNTNGELVMSGSTQGSETRINISSLSPGIYYLRTGEGNRTSAAAFIRIH